VIQQSQMRLNRCVNGVWDESVPGIKFDESGASNYYHMYRQMESQYPRGDIGAAKWSSIVEEIRHAGRTSSYDCIVGVSGGTDSCYLLHLIVERGLRPLAVTIDNGFSTDKAVSNIKKMTSSLGVDLETYVIDYEEMKDILTSYLKSGLPWVDFPTDHAIKSVLYRTAKKEKVKHVLIGHDFRSEGTQPSEWTYGDSKQLTAVHKSHGARRLKTFPSMSYHEQLWLAYVRKIKAIYPFYHLEYFKSEAQALLRKKYDWTYYGGHHHENVFTRFAITYWMKGKYGIDKRIITLSAQILNGEVDRQSVLENLQRPPNDADLMERDKDFILTKLNLTKEEFQQMWDIPMSSIYDYPSYKRFTERFAHLLLPLAKLVLPQLPSYFIQMSLRSR